MGRRSVSFLFTANGVKCDHVVVKIALKMQRLHHGVLKGNKEDFFAHTFSVVIRALPGCVRKKNTQRTLASSSCARAQTSQLH